MAFKVTVPFIYSFSGLLAVYGDYSASGIPTVNTCVHLIEASRTLSCDAASSRYPSEEDSTKSDVTGLLEPAVYSSEFAAMAEFRR